MKKFFIILAIIAIVCAQNKTGKEDDESCHVDSCEIFEDTECQVQLETTKERMDNFLYQFNDYLLISLRCGANSKNIKGKCANGVYTFHYYNNADCTGDGYKTKTYKHDTCFKTDDGP